MSIALLLESVKFFPAGNVYMSMGFDYRTMEPVVVVTKGRTKISLDTEYCTRVFREYIPGRVLLQGYVLKNGRKEITLDGCELEFFISQKDSVMHNIRVADRVYQYFTSYIELCFEKGRILEPHEEFIPEPTDLDKAHHNGRYFVDFPRLFTEIGFWAGKDILYYVKNFNKKL